MAWRHNKNSIPVFRRERNLFAWSLLAGLILFAALAGPFFAGRIYSRDDLGGFHLPVRDFYARQIAQGEAFDWMPQLFSGFYLTGEGQAGMYHPLHLLLYRWLPLQRAVDCEYLLTYPFMLAGTWLFLRRLIGSRSAAMFGAVIFTFSSFNLLHFIHPNAVAIVAHIPWLLWTIDIVLLDVSRVKVYCALTAMALMTGSQLLLGYPQYVWFSLFAEAAYTIYVLSVRRYVSGAGGKPINWRRKIEACHASRWPDLLLAKCIGLFLGGVQLLPTIDALVHSARNSADTAFAYTNSLHPLNLMQLAAPYLFENRGIGDNTHEEAIYLGAVPLMLIVWLIMNARELGVLKYLARAAGLFAALVLLLALGEYGQIYRLQAYLPLVGNFRCPSRYIVLFQLAAAVLAALGFLLLSRMNRRQQRQQQAARAVSLAKNRPLLTWRQVEPLWLLAIFSAAMLLRMCFHGQPRLAPLPLALIGPVLFIAAAFLITWTARGSRWSMPALILLTAADLGVYGMSYSIYPDCPRLENYLADIRTPPGPGDGRVIASLYRYDEPGIRTGDQIVMRGWSRADGYAGLEPQRLLDYKFLPALRVAGVRWVRRGPTTNDISGLIPRDDIWSEVPDPLARVRLVDRIIASSHPAADIAKIDVDSEALCEVSLALPPAVPGSASLVEYLPGRLSIRTNAPSAQLLVVAESYHPGWKATVNGSPAQVFCINGDFMGCLVGPGTQSVMLQFQPASLRTGRLISYLGLGFLPFCILAIWLNPAIPKPEEPRK
jgi:hypothetical protein